MFNLILRHDAFSFDLRSEEHTSELQSRENLVCRLLLEKNRTATYRCIGPCRCAACRRAPRSARHSEAWVRRNRCTRRRADLAVVFFYSRGRTRILTPPPQAGLSP